MWLLSYWTYEQIAIRKRQKEIESIYKFIKKTKEKWIC